MGIIFALVTGPRGVFFPSGGALWKKNNPSGQFPAGKKTPLYTPSGEITIYRFVCGFVVWNFKLCIAAPNAVYDALFVTCTYAKIHHHNHENEGICLRYAVQLA